MKEKYPFNLNSEQNSDISFILIFLWLSAWCVCVYLVSGSPSSSNTTKRLRKTFGSTLGLLLRDCVSRQSGRASPALRVDGRRSFIMAWRSHGGSNDELVDNLKKNGVFSSDRIAQVMKKVDRAHYCHQRPYQDSPQSIGYSVTISAPHMHASALQLLLSKLKPGT